RRNTSRSCASSSARSNSATNRCTACRITSERLFHVASLAVSRSIRSKLASSIVIAIVFILHTISTTVQSRQLHRRGRELRLPAKLLDPYYITAESVLTEV